MLQFLTFDLMNLSFGDPIRRRCALLFSLGLLCWLFPSLDLHSQSLSGSNTTPTWEEVIAAYTELAKAHPEQTNLQEFGASDVGRPLHLFTMGPETAPLRMLINNAIHPGEPCGVNASIAWATSLLTAPEGLPEGVHIGIVPMYNIGGGLRRNCCTRANQNGPDEYGFRGNARNLDLNRDFIKCDSRNALSFNKMFSDFSPDIFVDTHTSNGADYQATLTLITTQPDKLGGPLGAWLEDVFTPMLYSGMAERGETMVPYVNSIQSTPDGGITDFLETPRYSTGYGALHHAIGFTTEAHMLKPFPDRVQATQMFLEVLLEAGRSQSNTLREKKRAQHTAFLALDSASVAWELDTTAVDALDFPGYEARYEWSNVTGERRLKYDHSAPYNRKIDHYHTFTPSRAAPVPQAYVIPQAWRHVLERLRANQVEYHQVPNDTVMALEVTRIASHSALGRPYEGHHYRTIEAVKRSIEEVQLFAGDWIVPVDQAAARYLVETLSPEAVDAFMAWNFFDSTLQQKEYFSSYVFEDTAEEMLKSRPDLQQEFDRVQKEKKREGGAWSARQQLDWLYKRSDHFEQTPARYPIFSIPKNQSIPFYE